MLFLPTSRNVVVALAIQQLAKQHKLPFRVLHERAIRAVDSTNFSPAVNIKYKVLT